MKNLLIPCVLLGAVLLVLPDMAPSERALDAARGQVVATEATLGPPSEVRIEYLAEPPEMSPELMENIREKVECCAHKPIPPIPVESGTQLEGIVPMVPQSEVVDPSGKAPEDFMFYTNNDLGAGAPSGYTSVVNEPCVGNNGRCVFQSGNWHASLSTDFGQTFSFVNPYTEFPSTAGGFCCDQIVIYDPSRDCLFWLLLYLYDGSYNNVLRLAVANSFSSVENQIWYYYDISAATFGLASGHWLDFPDLVLGANSLYLTSNYVWRDNAFVSGTLIARFPLDQLAAGGVVSYSYYGTSARYSFRATHGADTVMYWAAHNTTSSIRIYQWTEGSGTIYSYDRSVTTWNNAVRTAPGPDGRDWLGYADARILGAWVTDAFEPGGAVGFMWSASQGGAYPYPYVRVARFRVSDKTLINEPIIWNSTTAFAYPSVNVNTRGHLAGVLMMGGGSWYPTCAAFVYDDYSSPPFPGGTVYVAVTGTSGPYINRSGDYLSTRPCHPYSNTWIGTAFSLQGGPSNSNARPRFLWFGRERDIPRSEPQNLYAFNGYHEAVPLVWGPPPGVAPLGGRKPFEVADRDQPNVDPPATEKTQPEGGVKQTVLAYNVYRSGTPGGPYTLIANVDRQYYRDEAVVNGNTYYYVVTALFDIVEESGYSNESAGSPVFDGYCINSGWASIPPVLNGLIEPAEWRTANAVDITAPGVSPSVTLYVMNDDGHLYLAVDDPGNVTLDDWDQFGPYFDENHDYEWPPSSPSGEGNFWVEYFAAGCTTKLRGIYGWWPSHYGADAPVVAPGVNQAIGISSGHAQFEVEIDLAASELNAVPGDIIGWFIYAQIVPEYIFSGWWPQEHALSAYPWDAWLIPATYGDLELAVAPDIDVSPSSFTFVVPEGGVSSDLIAVWNTASPPAGDLAWHITEHEVTLHTKDGREVPLSLKPAGLPPTTEGSDRLHQVGDIHLRDQHDPTDNLQPGVEHFRLSTKAIGDLAGAIPFPPATSFINGLAWGDGTLWATDFTNNLILELDGGTGAVLSSFPAPGGANPSELAHDGTYLYHYDFGMDSIYQIDPVSGMVVNTFFDEFDDEGLTSDGTYLWRGSGTTIARMDTWGNVFWTIPGPGLGFYCDGLAWDGSTLWYHTNFGDALQIHPFTGAILQSFSMPVIGEPNGLAFDGTYLRYDESDRDSIYSVDIEFADCLWLSEDPTSGLVAPGGVRYVDVMVDASGLGAGTYECEMHIHSNDPDESPWIVPVTLIVPEPPDIAVSPSSLTFTVPPGGSDSKTLTVNNTALPGALDLMWHIAEQEVTLMSMNGVQVPADILSISRTAKRVEHDPNAEPTSIGLAPRNFTAEGREVVNAGKTVTSRPKLPDDSGFGPDPLNSVVAEAVLNDPGTLIFHGGVPAAHYAGAEFGSTGDFSFMYGLDYDTDEFVTIDVGTGTVTSIGTATPHGSESWSGLAMDPTDGTMYASGTDIIQSSLYTVNVATGVVTRIGEITNAPAIIAIAVSPWGEMYGVDIVNDVLVHIDKTTGTGTVIGSIGFDANFSQGMDFDESDGTLYLAAYNMGPGAELRIADIFTGYTVLVGPLGDVFPGGLVELTGFGVATVGPDCPWLAYDPMSGIVPPRSSEDVDVIVDATGLSDGDYECRLMVQSNDPDEPIVEVPVHLSVTAPAIGGVVRDSVSGDPIVGATVEAWDSYPDGTLLTRDATDGSGEYGLSGLAPGIYDVRAHAMGYYPKVHDDIMTPSSGVDFDLAGIPEVSLTSTWCDFWSDNSTFEGFPVQIGDVVVAEDPDEVICGVFTVNTVGAYGLMHVYGDDPTTPGVDEGAESGDMISFLVNRCLGMARGPESPVWMDGVVRNVDLEGRCVVEQEIALWEGWNLFSFYTDCPMCAPVCSVATVLAQVGGNYLIVRGFDQQGISHCQRNNGALTYDPSLPPAFSDLVYLYPGYGYWVKMAVDDTITLMGARVDPHAELELDENWNLRGYLPEIEDSVAHALASIDGNYVIVRGFDQQGMAHCQGNNGALTYDPNLPPAFSDLVFLWPGFGYWMKMTARDTLIYPVPLGGCRGGVVMASSEGEDEVTPTSEWTDFWGEATFGERPVRMGDVVTVRDPEGVKCGEFVVRMEGYFGLLHVYGDDASTPKVDEGAEAGDELTFWVNGEEAEVQEGKAVWMRDGEVSRIDLVTTGCGEGMDAPIPKVFRLSSGYPNPFRREVAIHYEVPRRRAVSVRIYNIAGELVRTLVAQEKEPGYHRVTWDGSDDSGTGVVPGVYFCRFEAEGIAQTKKLTFVK